MMKSKSGNGYICDLRYTNYAYYTAYRSCLPISGWLLLDRYNFDLLMSLKKTLTFALLLKSGAYGTKCECSVVVLVLFQESAIRFDSPSDGSIFDFDSKVRSTVKLGIELQTSLTSIATLLKLVKLMLSMDTAWNRQHRYSKNRYSLQQSVPVRMCRLGCWHRLSTNESVHWPPNLDRYVSNSADRVSGEKSSVWEEWRGFVWSSMFPLRQL